MLLKNVKIDLKNVSDAKDDTLFVNSVYAKTAYNSESKDIIAYDIYCAARRGDQIKVTVPSTLSKKITKLTDLVKEDSVRVRFTGLNIKVYAFVNEFGKLISGVSGTATDFIIPDDSSINDFELEDEK